MIRLDKNVKTDNSKTFNLQQFEETTIDLDSIGVKTIRIKYMSTIYKIDIERFLKEFGTLEEIVFNSKK